MIEEQEIRYLWIDRQESIMKGTLKIMDRTGHTTVGWSTDLQETVEAANQRFNDMLKEGYTAFRLQDTKTGEQIAEFDVSAESILMIPRLVGG